MDSPIPIDPKLVVTTDTLPGYQIVRALGTAEGIGILFGPTGFTPNGQKERTTETMLEAYMDMISKARDQGAHAIIGLRYIFHSNQVIIYGTAVTIKPHEA